MDGRDPDDRPVPPDGAIGLDALAAALARDLEMLAWPMTPWVPPRQADDGSPILDVLIVGAGQCGLATAFALRRERVDNVLCIDAAPAGREGPWTTYARMPILRSPKHITGLELGLATLTFRAWYEAQWGRAAYEALYKIPTPQWMQYLEWYRSVLDLPVVNDCRLLAIEPAAGHLVARVRRDGGEAVYRARKIALCTGFEGTGGWWMPEMLRALPPGRAWHAADPDIDFAAMAGARVGVVGAGASAFDQAGTALEHGAAEVHLFCRKPELNRVQPLRALDTAGFMKHFADLPDEWRWRFMNTLLQWREPPPPETWERVTRHDGFRLHVGAALTGCAMAGDAVRLETTQGAFTVDHVLAGTGVHVDLSRNPELAGFADRVALWRDRYQPPAGEENPWIDGFPWLGAGFELTEREPGTAPFLKDIHVFTFGGWLSNGLSGGGMNGLRFAVPRLVAGLTRGLFVDDAERHFRRLADYGTREFHLGRFADPAR